MLNKLRVRSNIVLALSVLFILSALAPASFAQKGPGNPPPSVVVVDHAAEGNVVHVTVRNLSHTPQTVYVFVDATVSGATVRGVTPVFVSSKGTSTTLVGFMEVVEEVGSVGIIDDGTPQ